MAGLVEVEGVDTDYVTAPLEEIFARAFDDQAFDVTELSFSNYLYLTSTGNCPYVGLPVFPSRAFRHSAIYIRTDRGIRGPRDLAGRAVGVREYSMTAALVARGVLEDDFGLRAAEVSWRYGPADAGASAPIGRVRPTRLEPVPLAIFVAYCSFLLPIRPVTNLFSSKRNVMVRKVVKLVTVLTPFLEFVEAYHLKSFAQKRKRGN